jgi:hypothetical protein
MAVPASQYSQARSLHEGLVKSMQVWVERHPNPDVPALSVAGGEQFTPRQLLKEVIERSDSGLFFEELVATAAARSSVKLDEILAWFEREDFETENRAFSGQKY